MGMSVLALLKILNEKAFGSKKYHIIFQNKMKNFTINKTLLEANRYWKNAEDFIWFRIVDSYIYADTVIFSANFGFKLS